MCVTRSAPSAARAFGGAVSTETSTATRSIVEVLVPAQGFEPRLGDSKSPVLPLDDAGLDAHHTAALDRSHASAVVLEIAAAGDWRAGDRDAAIAAPRLAIGGASAAAWEASLTALIVMRRLLRSEARTHGRRRHRGRRHLLA